MDDMAQQLLMAHLTGGGTSVAEVVAQMAAGDDDPTTAQLLAALRQREAAADAGEDDDDGVEFDAEAADVMQRLYAEVECLRARTDTLAAALGACPRCFGDDELCPVCAGRGRPGGRRPDPALFAELVVPAIERAEPELTPAAFLERA